MEIEKFILNLYYPKPLMSISELVKMGFSRDTLKEYSRVKDAPITWSVGGGKIFFVTSELNEFIRKVEKRKKSARN